MKKIIFLSVSLIIVIIQTTIGQHLMLTPLVEKTITGYEYGSALTFRTKSQFSFGAFYQGNIAKTPENTQIINPFYGMLLTAPLLKCDRLNFHANTRIGFVNNIFLAVVPGIETEIKVFNALSLGIGMSIRKGFLSANGNIKFKI